MQTSAGSVITTASQYFQDTDAQESPFVSEVRASVSARVACNRQLIPATGLQEEPMTLVLNSSWFTPNEGWMRTWLGVVQESWTALVYGAPCHATAETERAHQILRRIETNAPHGNALAVRLRYLMSAADEETAQDPGLAPLSVPSLTDFAEFLVAEPRIAKPSLTLTLEGHIRAEWRKDADHRVAAEFTGGGEAQLVVFAPRRNDPATVLRFSKRVSVSALAQAVEPYDTPFLAPTM